MLEKILRAIVLGVAVGFNVGCSNPEFDYSKPNTGFFKSNQEIEKIEKPDFKTKTIRYQYYNGIEAEVQYTKHKTNGMILISVSNDKNNLLIEGTPRTKPIAWARYRIEINGKRDTREIKFNHNGYIVAIPIENGELENILVTDPDTNETEAYSIPLIFEKKVRRHFRRVNYNLGVREHILLLNQM